MNALRRRGSWRLALGAAIDVAGLAALMAMHWRVA